MKTPSRETSLVLLLGVLAIAQAGLLAAPQVSRPYRGGAPDVMIGGAFPAEALNGIEALREHAPERPTLVMVYAVDCPHTPKALPVWKDWLEGQTRSEINVVALSRDSFDDARNYIQEHALDVPLVSMPQVQVGTAAFAPFKRTPWLYVIDTAGTVHFTGHGTRMGTVDSVLAAIR